MSYFFNSVSRMTAYQIKARIQHLPATCRDHHHEDLKEVRDDIERIPAIGVRLELYQLLVERMLR